MKKWTEPKGPWEPQSNVPTYTWESKKERERERVRENIWRNNGQIFPKFSKSHESTHPKSSTHFKDKLKDIYTDQSQRVLRISRVRAPPWSPFEEGVRVLSVSFPCREQWPYLCPCAFQAQGLLAASWRDIKYRRKCTLSWAWWPCLLCSLCHGQVCINHRLRLACLLAPNSVQWSLELTVQGTLGSLAGGGYPPVHSHQRS